VPDADSLSSLYMLVGTSVVAQVAAAGVGVVKWLGSRTVERDDKDRESLRESLKDHEDRFTDMNRKLADLDRAVLVTQSEVKQTHELVGGIRGAVAEIKASLDTRFDKQADFYRASLKEHVTNLTAQLEKLEYQIRQDTTRAIHDAAIMRSRAKKG
jgi:chromosome segregation ATPase